MAKSITRIPRMSLDDLPTQPPLNPQADRYGLECLARSREALQLTRSSLDIAYGPSYWQKLDVFGPLDGGHRDLPVLVFFHGGGWTHGYKEWCGFMAPAIMAFPALFVSVSYRLLPEVDFPAPMEDGLAAFRWVYDHIADPRLPQLSGISDRPCLHSRSRKRGWRNSRSRSRMEAGKLVDRETPAVPDEPKEQRHYRAPSVDFWPETRISCAPSFVLARRSHAPVRRGTTVVQ
jgi:alpha/beta hydrolase fold